MSFTLHDVRISETRTMMLDIHAYIIQCKVNYPKLGTALKEISGLSTNGNKS